MNASPSISGHTKDVLKKLATYIWWKTPDEALEFPWRIITQVMNMGTWEDVQLLAETIGDDMMRDALKNAEAGWFNFKSWHYWHHRLGLLKIGDTLPPMPKRHIPGVP